MYLMFVVRYGICTGMGEQDKYIIWQINLIQVSASRVFYVIIEALCQSPIYKILKFSVISAQGLIGDLVSEIFDINIEYLGCIASSFAKVCAIYSFLAHLVYQPRSLIQSCFVCHRRWHHPALALASLSVHTSPWHMVRHRNFILGTHVQICPPYMHIKYLMILTCSFKWQPFWYFSLICYPAHIGSHRDFISHILKYLLFTYIHK